MRRIVLILSVLTVSGVLALLVIGAVLCASANVKVGLPPFDLEAESVTLPSTPAPVVGWLVRSTRADGVVLLLHGVRANRLAMLDRARFLHRLGYAVLMIDLPAHGESVGSHITFGHDESRGVVVALDYLRRTFPGQKIGVIGTSLGAASLVLADLAQPPDAAVLESIYPTIEDATADRLALRIGSWARALAPLLLRQLPLHTGVQADQLRPIERIDHLGAPVLIVAGTDDRHTTLAETLRLFEAAREPKALWIVDGAGHVDLHTFDPDSYERRIGNFLADRLRGNPR